MFNTYFPNPIYNGQITSLIEIAKCPFLNQWIKLGKYGKNDYRWNFFLFTSDTIKQKTLYPVDRSNKIVVDKSGMFIAFKDI